MTAYRWQVGLVSVLAVGGAIAVPRDYALAQQSNIVPDNTLGAESSVVIPLDEDGLPIDAIAGGAERGQNLFHSFQEFNVDAERGAYFYSPSAAIQNILARVTGGNPSEILGTLGTFGESNPNLFLINPNGIIFGANASLDVGGAFVATTANAIQLGSTGIFATYEPTESNLLTVNPSALFFNALANQSQIINRSRATSTILGISFREFWTSGTLVPINISGLQVLDSQSLSLIGGDVVLEGGNLTAPRGRIELGSIAGTGLVSLNQIDRGWALGYESIQNFGDIQLSQLALVDASGEGGGDIRIQGSHLDLSQGSYIFADTLGSGDGGEVLVHATELVALRDSSWIRADVFGSGTGGDLTINTGQLIVQDGTYVSASTFDEGQAGNLTVNASESVELIGTDADGFSSSLLAETLGTGAAGDLTINSGRLTVQDGAQVSTSTFRSGTGGNLSINTGQLIVQNGATVSAKTFGVGDAGNLNIAVERLIVNDNEALVATSSEGEGDAGDLSVRASDSVELNGPGGLFAQVNSGTGAGGDLIIETKRLSINNGAAVSTSTGNLSGSTPSERDAGNLTVRASESVEVKGEGSGISAGTLSVIGEPGRDGGNLTIETEQLNISEGGFVASFTSNAGDAGDLVIRASDSLEVSEGTISTENLEGTGDGGNLTIETGQLIVREGSQVRAGTADEGQGGSLTVTAPGSVELIGVSADGQSASSLSTATRGAGAAGDLRINTGRLIIRDGAQVSAGVGRDSQGKGGNLEVTASDSVELSGTTADGQFPSFLSTQAIGSGDAGDLRIDTGRLILQDGAQILASTSGSGQGGTLEVAASDFVELSRDGRLSTETDGAGDAGELIVTTGRLIVDGSEVSASTTSEGQGGTLTVNASESVDLFARGGLFTQTDGAGDAGNLTINTERLMVRDGSATFTGSLGEGRGRGGNLTVTSRESVEVVGTDADGTPSGLVTLTLGAGTAGNLTIEARRLTVHDGGLLSAQTAGEGNGGSITVNAKTFEAANGSRISSTTSSSGRAGDIIIDAAESFTLTNGARLSASTSDRGDAGNIQVNAANTISVSGGSQLRTDTSGQGNAGNVTIDAPNATVSLDGVATIDSLPTPSGIATVVRSLPGFIGDRKGGNISVAARSLSLTNGAQLNALAAGHGIAGNIFVDTSDSISLANNALIVSTLESGVVGNSGTIDAKTGSLSLTDGSQLVTNTFGQGNAGNIFVLADNSVALNNASGILSTVGAGGRGNGGEIDIQARSLSLTNGSQLQAIVFREQDGFSGGQGKGGNVQVNATDFINLSGTSPDGFSSGLFTSTERGAIGQAGNITADTAAFRVADGAVVNAQTLNSSPGGNITINANTFAAFNGGQVLTVTRSDGKAGNISLNVTGNITLAGSDSTFVERLERFDRDVVNNEGSTSGLFAQATADGNAGDLTLNTLAVTVQDGAQVSASTTSGVGGDITLEGLNSLQVSNGGQISTSTQTGQAGNLSVNAADVVQLDGNGSALSARATAGGNAGSLTINTSQLTVADGAEATVSSPQGQAGSLTVTTNSLRLDQGNLTAVTGRGQGEGGANINLQVQDLLLMGNESQISADALGTANGGNINIDTDFLIALPPQGANGSDIAANAFQGNGGRLNITAQGILGTEFRPSETVLNDITASSEFGSAGVVTLTTPDVDLQNSLTELAANFVSPDYVVAGSCLARRNVERGSFTVTGTGGLPSSPYEAMSGRYVVAGVQPIQGNSNAVSAANAVKTAPWRLGNPVQEAQGMTVTAEGRIILGTAPQLVAVAKAKDLICQPN